MKKININVMFGETPYYCNSGYLDKYIGNLGRYNLYFGQIYFVIWELHLSIWANILKDSKCNIREILCRGLSAPLGRFGPRGRERERSAKDFLEIFSSQNSLQMLFLVCQSQTWNIALLFCDKHKISLDLGLSCLIYLYLVRVASLYAVWHEYDSVEILYEVFSLQCACVSVPNKCPWFWACPVGITKLSVLSRHVLIFRLTVYFFMSHAQCVAF